MSSQQFSRHGMPAPSGGTPQISPATAAAANLIPVSQPSNAQGKRVIAGYLRSQRGLEFVLHCFPLFVFSLQGEEILTAAATLSTGSRITRRLEEVEGEQQHSEMTSRRPWWSDPTHRCRRSASHKLPRKLSPSSLALRCPCQPLQVTSHRPSLLS